MTERSLEVCDECGFDSRRWRVRDAITHLDALGWWWRSALADLDPADLLRRPADSTWSALEYGVHSAEVTTVLGTSIERVLSGEAWGPNDRINPPRRQAAPEDEICQVDPAQVLDDLETAGRNLATLAKAADVSAWRRAAEREGRPPARADSILFHAVHDASHHQMDVSCGISALELLESPTVGGTTARLVQINTSQGGVPKLPVGEAEVDSAGLVGDRQANRKHHGRPFQAICLWSTSALSELSAAGHPIHAGSVGENFTIEGLEWTKLRAGTRLRIGSSLIELSFPAVPCRKQARWFSDADFGRLSYDQYPEWARWYGWVRQPGSVVTGDAVTPV